MSCGSCAQRWAAGPAANSACSQHSQCRDSPVPALGACACGLTALRVLARAGLVPQRSALPSPYAYRAAQLTERKDRNGWRRGDGQGLAGDEEEHSAKRLRGGGPHAQQDSNEAVPVS
jgi:hypothetical protein